MALGTPVSRGTAKRFVQTTDISTGTFTPAADELLLCYIRTNGGTGGPDAVLGHDGGSAWVQLGSTEVSNSQSYHVYGCHSGASPSSDDVTVQNSTSGLMTMAVVSVTGADVSGTVANSFDQSAQNSAYTTNMTLTLTGATSLTMGFWGTNSNMVQTPEGTQLNTIGGNYNSTQLTTDYDSSGDASPSCTNASIQHSAFFAFEVKEAAAGGETVNVPVGTITLTGQTPTISATANITVSIPVGAINLTGQAPSVLTGDDVEVSVPLGAISLAGLTPVVQATNNISVDIPLGSISLATFAPTIQTGDFVTVEVPAGAISLSGFVPTIDLTNNISVSIPTGSISLAGFAPVVDLGDLTVNVNSGTITLSGFAPIVIVGGAIWTVQPDSVTNWSDQADSVTTWTIQ